MSWVRRAVRTAAHGAVESLWVIPSVVIGVAIAAALVLAQERGGMRLFSGDADSARQILSIIAGTVITVAATVFSLTILALEISTSAYSPRLLRRFLADPIPQTSLSLFVGTFVYCLALLASFPASTPADRLPQAGLASAAVASMGTFVALLVYVRHVADAMRVETTLRHLQRETIAAIERVYPPRGHPSAPHAPPEGDGEVVRATASGYVARIDLDKLADLARDHDVYVRMTVGPGAHVLQGTPIAHVSGSRDHTAAMVVDRAVAIGMERDPEQDPAYGFEQIADIAVRAADADPTTTIAAVRAAGVPLGALARHDTVPQIVRDKAGDSRVVVPQPTFAELLDVIGTRVRRYSATRVHVLQTFLDVLEQLAGVVADQAQRDAIAHQVERTGSAARAALTDPDDIHDVDEVAQRVRAALSDHGAADRP